jgi:hypothetical protein
VFVKYAVRKHIQCRPIKGRAIRCRPIYPCRSTRSTGKDTSKTKNTSRNKHTSKTKRNENVFRIQEATKG